MTPHPIAIEQHSQQRGRCRSCDAPIVWAVTVPNARRMPFNDPVILSPVMDPREGVVLVDMDRTTSHFATCPDAARWRRNKAPQGARVR